MRHTARAFALSLALTGALGASAAAPSAALAQDPQLAEAQALVEKAEKMLAELPPGDQAAANEVIKVNNQAIQQLNALAKKGATPEWKALGERAKATDKAARAKAKEPKGPAPTPPAAPTPPSGGTPPTGGAPAPTPSSAAKVSELTWDGEPDVTRLSQSEQQKYAGWKSQLEALWKKLAAEDAAALAQAGAPKRQSYDEAVSKIRAPFRSPGKFSTTCLPFVQKKEADFGAFYDARLAEGRAALAEGQGKTDDALTKAMAETDALEAALKTLKMGDAAAADALLAKRQAALDLLETTGAKLNPGYQKTKERLGAIASRIQARKAGQADDPSLSIDLSDAPVDELKPKDLERFKQWKQKFAANLKQVGANPDEFYVETFNRTPAENELGRMRTETIDRMPKEYAVHGWVKAKEDEYRKLLDAKAGAGRAKLDAKALDGMEAAQAAAQVKMEGLAGAELVAAETSLTAVADENEAGLAKLYDPAHERAKGLGAVVSQYRKSLAEKLAAAKSALAGAAAEKDARHAQAMGVLQEVVKRFDFEGFEPPAYAIPHSRPEGWLLAEFTEEKHAAWAKAIHATKAEHAAAIAKVEKAVAQLQDADSQKTGLRSPSKLSFQSSPSQYLAWLKKEPQPAIQGAVDRQKQELSRYVELGTSADDPAKMTEAWLRDIDGIAKRIQRCQEAIRCARCLAVVAKEIEGGDPAPHLAVAASLEAKIAQYQARSAAALATVTLEKELEHEKVPEWRKIAEEAMKFSRNHRTHPDKDQVHRFVVWERLTTRQSVEWSNLGRAIPIHTDSFQIRCIVKNEKGEYWIALKEIVYNHKGWENWELQQWHVMRTSYIWPIPAGNIDK